MTAVFTTHSFDLERTCCIFESEHEAKIYLEWLWKSVYEEELSEDARLDHERSYFNYIDGYGKIAWEGGGYMEFYLCETKAPDSRFRKERLP